MQHGILLAAQIDIDHPSPIIIHLCQLVARSLANEELFRADLMAPLHAVEPPSRSDPAPA